jgi:hypothetical protein
MKQALVLIACLLSTAAAGQDLNRLELGIHDLVEVKTLTGITLVVDPTKIIMAYALPRPLGRGAAITNIVGLAGGPQEIDEPANGLLERLNLKPYFVALTLPTAYPCGLRRLRSLSSAQPRLGITLDRSQECG